MHDLLSSYDVEVVAISADTPEQAAKHKARVGLSYAMLADPNRTTIRSYGLAITHMRYVTWFQDVLPIGIPTGFSTIAIPTTILIDEDGDVQWIDACTDYRMRSDTDRIEMGLTSAFGPPNRSIE